MHTQGSVERPASAPPATAAQLSPQQKAWAKRPALPRQGQTRIMVRGRGHSGRFRAGPLARQAGSGPSLHLWAVLSHQRPKSALRPQGPYQSQLSAFCPHPSTRLRTDPRPPPLLSPHLFPDSCFSRTLSSFFFQKRKRKEKNPHMSFEAPGSSVGVEKGRVPASDNAPPEEFH